MEIKKFLFELERLGFDAPEVREVPPGSDWLAPPERIIPKPEWIEVCGPAIPDRVRPDDKFCKPLAIKASKRKASPQNNGSGISEALEWHWCLLPKQPYSLHDNSRWFDDDVKLPDYYQEREASGEPALSTMDGVRAHLDRQMEDD